MENFSVSKVSFQSRCPQIREAQQVCHLITENMPHISDTRLRGAYFNLMSKNLPTKTNLRYIDWMHSMIQRINDARELYNGVIGGYFHNEIRPMRLFNQLKFEKLGNCYENGKAAEFVFKMNGMNHVRSASLKRGNRSIDHFVCVFNRDGSVFDGTIKNNQTIIVDPWLGKADFANNMFKIYDNTCRQLLTMPAEGKFNLQNVENTRISDSNIDILKMTFPKLVYKK